MPDEIEPTPPPATPVGGASGEFAPVLDAAEDRDPLFDPFVDVSAAKDAGNFALAPDPWAHRRGEPRLFAFFWTLYVFIAVAGSVAWLARTGGWILGGYGPAGRIMLMVVAVGATVLWPMTRLSQASPGAGSVAAMLADSLVVLLPIQMVVWPMAWLAGWPLTTIYGVAAIFAAWVVLMGGMLAFALGGRAVDQPRDPALYSRALWMAAVLFMVLIGPAATSTFRGGHHPDWLPVISPISGVLALTGTGISGPQQALTFHQWLTIVIIGAAGLGWWAAAIVKAALYPRAGRA